MCKKIALAQEHEVGVETDRSKAKTSVTRGSIHELKKNLVCRRIVPGRRHQFGDGIVEGYANEEHEQ